MSAAAPVATAAMAPAAATPASPWLALRDLLLPRRCLVCVHPLEGGWPRPVCDGCLAEFEALSFEGVPLCPRCGVPCGPPGIGARGARCGRCRAREPLFFEARSFGHHEGGLRTAVVRMKKGEPALARPLGLLVARAAALLAVMPDVVVPVPVHGDRLLERGFKQAAFLAREAARALGLPCAHGALVRLTGGPKQTIAGREERAATVRGAFAATRAAARLRDRSVLLVDDVITTGATSESCAAALLLAGAARVSVAAVARAGSGAA